MTVEQAVYNIRHAVYGEEVRESIAEGIETMDAKIFDYEWALSVTPIVGSEDFKVSFSRMPDPN